MVYMDQPVGTGFSHAKSPLDYDANEKTLAEDFYRFLVRFLEKYPEYKKRSMFITGESYAGKYIPAISAKIVAENNADIALVGSAIGNGLVDPYSQYPAYVTFSVENKIIGEDEGKVLAEGMKEC